MSEVGREAPKHDEILAEAEVRTIERAIRIRGGDIQCVIRLARDCALLLGREPIKDLSFAVS